MEKKMWLWRESKKKKSWSCRRDIEGERKVWLWRTLIFLMLNPLSGAPLTSKLAPSPSPSPSPPSAPAGAHHPHHPNIAKAPAPVPVPVPAQTPYPSASPSPHSHSHPKSPFPSPSLAPSLPPTASNGTSSHSPLDPAQLSALRSLGVHLSTDPCTSSHDILLCDNASPLRHLIALELQLCAADAELTTDILSKLETLQALSFRDCPMLPVHVPPKLLKSLTSFSCIASLGMTVDTPDAPGLPGIWLSKFDNLKEIIVTDVKVNASGLSIILSGMKHLQQIQLSDTNITGLLPVNTWPLNVTSLHLSGNALHGGIPKTIGKLDHLLEIDLSDNQLTGRVPDVFDGMKKLQKLVLGSNALSGSIPESITGLSSLMYLDLSKNKFNGSIPAALNKMKALRHLDLSNNEFSGPLPFNKTFLSKLSTLKVGGNTGICYNHTTLKSSFLAKIPNCDSSGLPILPPGSSLAPSPSDALGPAEQLAAQSPKHTRKGPRTVVAAVAITLVVLVVIIVVVVVVSKCRSRKY